MNRFEEIFGIAARHTCGKTFISADDPMKGIVGWTCVRCNSYWHLTLTQLRNSVSKEYEYFFQSQVGRKELVDILNNDGTLSVFGEMPT